LDLATAPQLRDVLREAELHALRLVLDLRELTFLDTAGVHVIADASQRARQAGHRLVLARGPLHVDGLFRLTGMAASLEIVDLDPTEPPIQALVRLTHSAAA
jgi:anti-sigma B factor antagonist